MIQLQQLYDVSEFPTLSSYLVAMASNLIAMKVIC